MKWLIFFGQPISFSTGTGIEGLCQIERATVYFSDRGEITRMDDDKVYAFAEHVTFDNPWPSASHRKELDKGCNGLSNKHLFSFHDTPGEFGNAIYAISQHADVNNVQSIRSCLPSFEKIQPFFKPGDRCWNVGLGGNLCHDQQWFTVIVGEDKDRHAVHFFELHNDRVVC